MLLVIYHHIRPEYVVAPMVIAAAGLVAGSTPIVIEFSSKPVFGDVCCKNSIILVDYWWSCCCCCCCLCRLAPLPPPPPPCWLRFAIVVLRGEHRGEQCWSSHTQNSSCSDWFAWCFILIVGAAASAAGSARLRAPAPPLRAGAPSRNSNNNNGIYEHSPKKV